MTGTVSSVESVHFVDATNGWLCSDYGVIQKTVNGGQNWTTVLFPGLCIPNSILFIDTQRGWAAGQNGVIITTQNGGNNWIQQETNTTKFLRSIFMVSEQNGWAVGDAGTILKYSPSIPSCISTIPLHQKTNIATNTKITWPNAPGCEDAYRLSLGTIPGGSDLLNNQIVPDTAYQLAQPLPAGKTIYVRIVPFNGVGEASGCQEFSFTTAGGSSCTLVTTTADSGAGSLREAILCATTTPGPDTIRFNIPGAGPHIITFQSELYVSADTGGLVIDATTQPNWQPGRVVIDGSNTASAPAGLWVFDNCKGLDIYGVTFRNASSGMMALRRCRNVSIGAAGKGNIFYANERNLPVPPITNPDIYSPNIQLFGCTNAIVQANTFGRTETSARPVTDMVWGITASGENIQIGGSRAAGEGNTFAHHLYAAIGLWAASDASLIAQNIRIYGNNIGTDATGTQEWGNDSAFDFGSNAPNSVMQQVTFGDGTADRSNVAKYNAYAVTEYGTVPKQVAFRRNVFACNDIAIALCCSPARTVVITKAEMQQISGTALPGDMVEVYISQNTGCPNTACQGTVWLGNTNADASGKWVLNAPFATAISVGNQVTATGTGNGQTGVFAVCATVQNSNTCNPMSDSLELVKFYDATGGINWSPAYQSPWLVKSQPIWKWHGISTNAQGCATAMVLSDPILTGNLLDLNLPALTELSITRSNLNGNIPNFSQLPALKTLSLSNNTLSGSIPDFTQLPKLALMDLDSNMLSGTVPNFTKTPLLEYLDLAQNALDGEIPNFDSIPKLKHLNLSLNQLSGLIPNFDQIPALEFLELADNQLSGTIPDFGKTPNLTRLYLNFNRLIGPVPALSQLIKLTTLGLDNNRLTFAGIPFQVAHNYSEFSYAPQAPVFHDTLLLRSPGQSLDFSLDFDEAIATNVYKWYKDGIYQPAQDQIGNNNLLIPNLKTTDAGQWTVEVTNPGAPDLTLYSRTITLQVCSTAPSPSITSPTTLCDGSATLSTGSPLAGHIYRWSTGDTTPALTVSSPGLYTVTVTNTQGCEGTATRSIGASTAAPTVSIGGSVSICGAQAAQLNATGANISRYEWLGPNGFTANSQQPTVNSPGIYTVTAYNTAECPATATATVSQQPAIAASLSAPQGTMLDCQRPTLPLQASGGDTYTWTGPGGFTSTNQQPSINIPGTYTATVTDSGTGCADTASVVISQDINIPDAAASIVGSISCAQPTATLLGSSSISGVTYTWVGPCFSNNSQNQQNAVVCAPGAYVLSVTASNGCMSVASVTVTGSSAVPVASATGGAVDCQVSNIVLTASSSIGGSSYDWKGPGSFVSSAQNPSVSLPGDYTVTVTASPGCTATAIATVADNRQLPDVSATGGVLPCVPSSLVLQGMSGTSGVIYSWTGPNSFTSGIQQPTVNSTGIYTLTATNPANACTATATAIVTPAVQPQAIISGAKPICPSQSVVLTATGGIGYQWQKPDGTFVNGQLLTVSQTGAYTVTVTDANNCTAMATALISPAPPLNVGIAGATAFCLGGNTTLSVTPGSQYLWNGPSGFVFTGQQPVVNVPGAYSVTVTDASGCTGSTSTLVAQHPIPVAQLLFSENSGTPGDSVVCSGDAVAFTAGGGTAYQFWVNGVAQGVFSPINTLNLPALTASVIVRVRVTNANQCQDSTQVGDGAGFEPLSIAVSPALNLGTATLSPVAGCPEDPVSLLIGLSNVPSGAYAVRWQLDNLSAQTTPVAFSPVGGGVVAGTLSLGVLPPGSHSCKVLSLGPSGTGCATVWASNNALSFEVSAPIQRALDTTICVGQVLTIGGKTYGQTGNYAPVMSAATGCDSTVLLKLTVVQQIVQIRQARFCYQDCYSFYGQLLCKSGFYEKTVAGPYCDSLIRLELSEELPLYDFKTVTICPGESYSVGDSVFHEPGGHEIRLKSVYGCDSIIILTLKVHPFAAAFPTDALRICRDEQTTLVPLVKNCPNCQYKWSNGAMLPSIVASPPATTQYWVQVSMKDGPLMCVLRDTLELSVVQPSSQTRDTLLCPGEKLFGTTLSGDTMLVSKFLTAEDCDSTVTLKVKVFKANQFDAVRDQVLMPPKETRLTVEVTKNDIRPNGTLLDLRRGPQHGIAEKLGEDNIRYTLSDPDFFGTDSVLYALCPPGDCPDACDSAWLVVRIQAGSIEQAIELVPNVITPNGDGQNDFFDPLKTLEDNSIVVEEAEFTFFNRWGEVVHRIRPGEYPAGGWDGESGSGRVLPQATYYWLLRIQSGKEYVFKGAVNLLK